MSNATNGYATKKRKAKDGVGIVQQLRGHLLEELRLEVSRYILDVSIVS